MSDVISVMIGGAAGSALRFLVGMMLQAPGPNTASFPWPTFIVNVAGSFLLGAIVVLSANGQVFSRHQALLLGTGLCGGFTTFSTFSVETLHLMELQRLDLVAIYIVSTLVSSLAAAWLGVITVRTFI